MMHNEIIYGTFSLRSTWNNWRSWRFYNVYRLSKFTCYIRKLADIISGLGNIREIWNFVSGFLIYWNYTLFELDNTLFNKLLNNYSLWCFLLYHLNKRHLKLGKNYQVNFKECFKVYWIFYNSFKHIKYSNQKMNHSSDKCDTFSVSLNFWF